MKVIVESPFRALDNSTRRRYNAYSRRAILDSIKRGEAPIAFHRFYPEFLDDSNTKERNLGLRLSSKWYSACDKVVAYTDYGLTEGMIQGLQLAAQLGKPIECRNILFRSQAQSKASQSNMPFQKLLPSSEDSQES